VVQLDSRQRFCRICSYAADCQGCALPNDAKAFQVAITMYHRDSDFAFGTVWEPGTYDNVGEKIHRHSTADDYRSTGERPGGIPLQACFQAFSAEETLGEADPWYCSDCKAHKQARKKMDVWKLPQILIVHLKRFTYTSVYREKIDTFVDFPIEGLDMSRICANPDFADQALYDLYAISNHMGGMGGGHYTAYCKNLQTGKWWSHDDSRVSLITPTDIRSSSAYVLFYRRREAARGAAAGAMDPSVIVEAPSVKATTTSSSSHMMGRRG